MGKKIGSLLLVIALIVTSVFPVWGSGSSEEASGGIPFGYGEETAVSGTAEKDGEKAQYYCSSVVRNTDGMTDILRGPSGSVSGRTRSAARLSSSDSAAVTSAANTLRSAMVDRKSLVEISVKTSGMNGQTLAEKILDQAGQETSKAWEGDYLVYTLGGYQYSYWTYDNRTYQYTFFLYYRTTKKQENAVTSKVTSVINSLGISSVTPDYQKIRLIYDYICENTVYDYYHLYLDPNYDLMYTAYAALINKTAVCQGYALLLYRMLKEVGIGVRTVTGTSNGEGHMWNLITLRGARYNADSTWDAGSSPYRYFLRGNTYFNRDHFRDAEFRTSEYQTSSSDYVVKDADTVKYKLSAPKLKKAVSAAYNKIKITWERVANAEGYHVYVKENGKWKRIGSTTADSFTWKAVTGVNYTFTAAAYQMSGGKKVQGAFDAKGITGKAVLAKSSITAVTPVSSGFKLTWKKVPAAAGYQVFRQTGGQWVKLATVSALTYTDTTARPGETCKYRIRVYRRESGKTIFSQYSAAVSRKR